MSTTQQIDKCQEVHRVATELFHQCSDWVTFFREVLGIDGVIRKAYPDPIALADFEKTNEYIDIQQMVAKLRERNTTTEGDQEPTRVITVRMPKSLHEALRAEAHDRHTSMNKLCISKLLQMIDDGLVPQEI
jgi:predicted HicB family RNase H-like nuclease